MTTTDDLPVCVYCHRGTTPKQLVSAWLSRTLQRRYYAHEGCGDRRRSRSIPPDPLINRVRPTPNLAERLVEWNMLADEIDYLLTQCRSPRSLALSKTACAAWNATGYRKTDMTWALVDPRPDRPDEAGNHVRTLRWHIEKLRAALDREPNLHRRRCCNGSLPKLDLHLPDTIEAVREAYKRRELA